MTLPMMPGMELDVVGVELDRDFDRKLAGLERLMGRTELLSDMRRSVRGLTGPTVIVMPPVIYGIVEMTELLG